MARHRWWRLLFPSAILATQLPIILRGWSGMGEWLPAAGEVLLGTTLVVILAGAAALVADRVRSGRAV